MWGKSPGTMNPTRLGCFLRPHQIPDFYHHSLRLLRLLFKRFVYTGKEQDQSRSKSEAMLNHSKPQTFILSTASVYDPNGVHVAKQPKQPKHPAEVAAKQAFRIQVRIAAVPQAGAARRLQRSHKRAGVVNRSSLLFCSYLMNDMSPPLLSVVPCCRYSF